VFYEDYENKCYNFNMSNQIDAELKKVHH